MTAAVVGYSAITSLGADATETYLGLCQGNSGLGPLRGFRVDRFRGQQAYQIADGRQDDGPEHGRASRLVIEAIRQATDAAGVDPATVPVIIGTGLAELPTLEAAVCEGRVPTAAELDMAQAVRKAFGTEDVTTVVNACSASLHALAIAVDLLTLGEADQVVVAGVDILTRSMHGLLDRVQPVIPDVVRPFDSGPKGVIMGEGAAAVVLSNQAGEDAFEVRAVSMNCDAGHVTMPDQEGMAAAMRLAHTGAGVDPADIDLVMLHGTGTPQNDTAESAAMAAVFGDAIGAPAAVAIKSMTGHTSGASGLVAVVTALETMRHGTVPPNQAVREIIPEAQALALATAPVARECKLAQVNAFGFGGVNAVAIIGRGMVATKNRPRIGSAFFPVAAATAMQPYENPRAVLPQRGLRYKDLASMTAMAISTTMLADPEVSIALGIEPDRVAVVVGSNLCNADTVARVATEIEAGGIIATSPMDLPNASPNVVASSVAIMHGFRGPNLLVSGHPHCVDDAVQVARRLLSADRADHVLVIGIEPPTEIVEQIGGDRTGAVALLLSRQWSSDQPVLGIVDRAGFTPLTDRVEVALTDLWDRLRGRGKLSPAPHRPGRGHPHRSVGSPARPGQVVTGDRPVTATKIGRPW